MSDLLEQRVEALERQLAELASEVSGRGPQTQPASPDAPPTGRRLPPPMPPNLPDYPRLPLTEPLPAAPRREVDFEQLVGGRLLALVGGLAVVVGIAFFVALAVNHGWIGEGGRVTLAGCASAAMLVGGCWLYERKGRLQAALALVGSAIAGLFLTLTAATAGYDLIPTSAALPFALGIGVLATTIAVRWDARTVAGLGIGGTLAAPLLGNAVTTSGMAFLAVASASAAAVLVWRRWQWLAVGAFVLVFVQVTLWTMSRPSEGSLVVVLSVFAILNLGLALGYEVRDATSRLQPTAVLLVPFGALVLGALGFAGLAHGPGEPAGGLWLLGLAAAHAVGAGSSVAARRASVEITLVLLGAAVLLGDVAFGLLGDGWVLAVVWAVSAVGFAVVALRHPDRSALAQLALGGQLAIALGQVLLFDASPQLLVGGHRPAAGAVAALAAVMVAAFASARLLVDEPLGVRVTLDGLAMAALAYATALSFSGSPLLVAWAVAAVALAGTAGRLDDRVARVGALGFLALIAAHLLVFDAPLSALVDGLDSVATPALGLVLVAAVACLFVRVDPSSEVPPAALVATALVAVIYLGSTLIVDAARPGLGQTLLSVFWAGCGIAALVIGLRLSVRLLRIGGLALLCLAATKVFLYDLGALQSAYRVGSFIGLGLLLLGAGFAYQRLRSTARRRPANPILLRCHSGHVELPLRSC